MYLRLLLIIIIIMFLIYFGFYFTAGIISGLGIGYYIYLITKSENKKQISDIVGENDIENIPFQA
jgi:cytochrome bd-type quinol oxidase subunit 2